MKMNRKQVVKLIEKADRKAKEAHDATANADAAIATYWSRDGIHSPLWWLSADVRKTAELLTNTSLHLAMRAREEMNAEGTAK